MSKRKKKNQTEKVSPLTEKGYPISIAPELMNRFRGGRRSPLDDVLEEEDAQAVRDFKTMRVEQANLKRKLQMAKLQKELDKLEKEEGKTASDSGEMPRISAEMAQQLANLPDEERRRVIETYAMLRSVDQSKGKGDSLLPLIIGYSKSNPGSTQSDMVTYAKAMADQFKTGVEMMKSVMPKEKPSDATALLKIFADLVKDSVKKPMEDLAKNMQAQPSAFEQILMNPEMFARAKEIGMFGSREGGTGAGEIDLKIAELTTANQLEVKRLDLDWRKSMLERDAAERRSDNIMAALAPLTALFAGPVSQRMQQFGQQQAATHMPPPAVIPQEAIMINCSCGYKGPITFQGPPPDKIKCPSCGLDLNVGGAPPGENT